MLEIFTKRPMVILISILWGLGLATLFTSIANKRNLIIRGELPSNIEKQTFQYPSIDKDNNKCYNYKSYLVPCNTEIYKRVKNIY